MRRRSGGALEPGQRGERARAHRLAPPRVGDAHGGLQPVGLVLGGERVGAREQLVEEAARLGVAPLSRQRRGRLEDLVGLAPVGLLVGRLEAPLLRLLDVAERAVRLREEQVGLEALVRVEELGVLGERLDDAAHVLVEAALEVDARLEQDLVDALGGAAVDARLGGRGERRDRLGRGERRGAVQEELHGLQRDERRHGDAEEPERAGEAGRAAALARRDGLDDRHVGDGGEQLVLDGLGRAEGVVAVDDRVVGRRVGERRDVDHRRVLERVELERLVGVDVGGIVEGVLPHGSLLRCASRTAPAAGSR